MLGAAREQRNQFRQVSARSRTITVGRQQPQRQQPQRQQPQTTATDPWDEDDPWRRKPAEEAYIGTEGDDDGQGNRRGDRRDGRDRDRERRGYSRRDRRGQSEDSDSSAASQDDESSSFQLASDLAEVGRSAQRWEGKRWHPRGPPQGREDSRDKPEGWDGLVRESYPRGRKKVLLWIEDTKCPSEKRGVRILRKLSERAWELVEDLDWETFRGNNGDRRLLKVLDKSYEYSQTEDLQTRSEEVVFGPYGTTRT